MKLDASKPHATIHGAPGIAFQQEGRFFSAGGNEVDSSGDEVKDKSASKAKVEVAEPDVEAPLGEIEAEDAPAPKAAKKPAAKPVAKKGRK